MTDKHAPDRAAIERAPGWYTVKDGQGVWEPAEYSLTPEAGCCWWYRGGWYTSDEALGCEIGPRLYVPDEEPAAVAVAAAEARAAAIEQCKLAVKLVPSNHNAIREATRWECWQAINALAPPAQSAIGAMQRPPNRRRDETRFTPGPWIADDIYMEDGRRVRVSRYDGRDDYYLRCPSICECHVQSDGDDDPDLLVAEANARLIAAAPDLWNALTTLQYQLRYSWNGIFAGGEDDIHADALRSALEGAAAALAKARGEVPAQSGEE